MPNYITNVIYVKNNKEVLKHLVKKNEEGVVDIDFNIVKPMPKDLMINSGSDSFIVESKYSFEIDKADLQKKTILPVLDKIYDNTITQDEFLSKVKEIWPKVKSKFKKVYGFYKSDEFKDYETALKGYFNYKRYGYKDWYDWSIANWGTKWNGCNFQAYKLNGNREVISFETAWSCPVEYLIELSKVVKEPMLITYADEDIGYNYGILRIENGEVEEILTPENTSAGEALACRGEDRECVDDYYGVDNYTDDEISEFFDGKSRKELTDGLVADYDKASTLLDNLLK